MARHTFSFDGGEELTTMGAGWFVSYSYYQHLDRTHRNWNRISTAASRSSVYHRTTNMHNYWLQQVLYMNDDNLNKNTLGLSSSSIKEMAKKLLAKNANNKLDK
ncbi:MAG: hypothetical protein FWE84_05225 [Firmicutes bacterium]|nr:hypothetical protein [Bacillota bacterium]